MFSAGHRLVLELGGLEAAVFVALTLWSQSLCGGILRASAGPCTAACVEAHKAFGPRANTLQVRLFGNLVFGKHFPRSSCPDFVDAVFARHHS